MDRLITSEASPSRAATSVGPHGSQMSSQMLTPMCTSRQIDDAGAVARA